MELNKNVTREKEEKLNRIYTHTPYMQLKDYIKEEKKINKTRGALLQEVTELERYLNFLSPDQKPMDTDYLCNHVDPADIYDYVIHKRKGTKDTTVSARTAAVRLSIIRKFYKFLMTNSINKNLPALRNPTVSLLVPKVVPKAHAALPKEMIREVLRSILTGENVTERQRDSWEKTRFRDFAVLSLLCNTGLSLSQTVNLNLEDLLFGADTSMLLTYAESLYFQTELSAEDYLLELLNGNLQPETDVFGLLFENPVSLILFSDAGPRKLHLNKITAAALLFYLLLERDALEYKTGALFLSLRKRRMSYKTLENMIAKYFAPYTDMKVTPELIRKSYASYILKEDSSSLPFLAHRMGYKDTSYLKSLQDRSADDSESIDRSIGSLTLF